MDDLLTKTVCDRCKGKLIGRILSWFTEEVICMECSGKEKEIKAKLRAAGRGDMEGCGYIPEVPDAKPDA